MDPLYFEARVSPPLTVINAAMSALLVFANHKWLEAISRAQCFIDIVLTAVDVLFDQQDGLDLSGFASSVLGCASSVIGGFAGAVIAALGSLPAAIAAPIEAAILTIAGMDTFTIVASKQPSGSVNATPIANVPVGDWPTDRNDGPPAFWTWLGAASVWSGTGIPGYPDWVACDDNNTYCLVGYNDEEHVLVQTDGFEIIGTIADWYPNPKEALLILGMSEEVADQILGI
jgi:hypothetical protein